jgi:uncharacterized membrane protein YjjP (DUF1212 family)
MPLDDESAALLGELARALHQATVPADVLEQRLGAVARRLGVEGEFFTLQSFLAMELHGAGRKDVSVGRMSFDTHWNLTRMTAILAVADELADGRIGVADARKRLAAIPKRRNPYPNWLVVLAYGVYGAVVAARVGGNVREMLVAGVVGLAAGTIHYGTIENNTIDLQKSFLAAVVGSMLAFLFAQILPTFDQPRALFGGITLLVPAMVVVVGVHEIASEALESGVARLAYGLLRFAMLGAGVASALAITSFAAWPPSGTATPFSLPVTLALVGLGGVALIFCLQAPARDASAMVAAVLVAFATQELSKRVFGEQGAPLLAALVLGAVAYLHARVTGHAAPIMIVPGLLQLAPGFMGTKTTLHLLRPHASSVAQADGFIQLFVVALQLGLGLLIADILFRGQHKAAPAARHRPRRR